MNFYWVKKVSNICRRRQRRKIEKILVKWVKKKFWEAIRKGETSVRLDISHIRSYYSEINQKMAEEIFDIYFKNHWFWLKNHPDRRGKYTDTDLFEIYVEKVPKYDDPLSENY